MVIFTAPYEGERATLRAIDTNLGVDGLSQSATGQQSIVADLEYSCLMTQHNTTQMLQDCFVLPPQVQTYLIR